MRVCFLGQNVCALGFGVAMVQTYPLPEPGPLHAPPPGETEGVRPPPDYPLENLMARDLKRRPGRIV